MRIERPDWGDGQHLAYSPEPVTTDLPTEQITQEMESYSGSAEGDVLREAWEKEGGFDAALAIAEQTQAVMLTLAPSLEPRFGQLPTGVRAKLADQMRVSPILGRGTAAISAFEMSLTPPELTAYQSWVEQLSPTEARAIYQGFGGGER